MQGVYIQLISIAFIFQSFLPELNAFSYQNIDEWIVKSPHCGGQHQSPVNINLDDVKRQLGHSHLKLKNYQQTPKSMRMKNNGHTISITPDWFQKSSIFSGHAFKGQYVLSSIHFHWGQKNSEGSEHTISNNSFPLEMHMVHFNKKYNSTHMAGKRENGLLVIGILFNTYQVNNNHGYTLAPLMDSIKKVKSINTETTVPPFPFSNFELSENEEFYTYPGSLTTPPCSETVTWLIATRPRKVTESQMQVFREVNLANGDKTNFRPTQPLNGRVIKVINSV